MFEFSYPWLFVLLPLPLLIRRLLPAYHERREAVRAPFFDDLVELTGQTPSRGAVVLRPNLVQKALVPAAWILALTALARPQWVEDPIVRTESARDLMLAVDLSGSMDAQDFTDKQGNQISRLDAVKLVLDDFISRRKGDRMGLIVFGTQAFLQVPFTQDHETCRILLGEAQVRMAGPQTMIGDAIGLAIKLFEAGRPENRVLILLTDGNDTGSKVPPTKAAEIASQKGIQIHAVAMGDPTTVGEDELDIETLQKIADATNGELFQSNTLQELDRDYRKLDELVPDEFETLSYRPKRALFHWPLGALLVVAAGYHLTMAARSWWRREKRSDV